MDKKALKAMKDRLDAARMIIDGECDCRTPEYRALDEMHRILEALLWEHLQEDKEYNVPLPQGIQEALNSGDGTYRP